MRALADRSRLRHAVGGTRWHTGPMVKRRKETGRPSPAARLDGRVKIALAAAYAVALFLAESPLALGLALALLAVAAAWAQVPWRTVVAGAGPVYLIAAFLLLYNGVAAGWGAGILVAARVILLVYASILLVESSGAVELAEALRRLLAPLGRCGLHVRDVTTALSIALRFIPVTAEELGTVRAAQLSRGASLASGSVAARLRAHAGLLVPLFVGLFRRADRLATAMDARCFGAADRPTALDDGHFGVRDGLALSAGLILCVAVALVP